MEGEGAVQGVALPPERAVEYHRRQQKKQAEAEQGAVRALRREMPHQPEAAPGQHHVKQNGEELDEVQVGYGQIGDGGKKIEVGCVIVADRQLHGREAAPIPEGRGPLGEEHLVIGGLVVQQQGPEEEGQPNGQQGVQQPGTVQALPAEQPQRQGGQGQQEQKDGQMSGRSAQGKGAGGKQAQAQQGQSSCGPGEGKDVHRHLLSKKGPGQWGAPGLSQWDQTSADSERTAASAGASSSGTASSPLWAVPSSSTLSYLR